MGRRDKENEVEEWSCVTGRYNNRLRRGKKEEGGEAESEERIRQLLEQSINPALASHGGFAVLERIEDRDEGVAAVVTMGGGCQGCAVSAITLREGIEAAVREAIPEVTEIIDGTDHDAGENPTSPELGLCRRHPPRLTPRRDEARGLAGLPARPRAYPPWCRLGGLGPPEGARQYTGVTYVIHPGRQMFHPPTPACTGPRDRQERRSRTVSAMRRRRGRARPG